MSSGYGVDTGSIACDLHSLYNCRLCVDQMDRSAQQAYSAARGHNNRPDNLLERDQTDRYQATGWQSNRRDTASNISSNSVQANMTHPVTSRGYNQSHLVNSVSTRMSSPRSTQSAGNRDIESAIRRRQSPSRELVLSVRPRASSNDQSPRVPIYSPLEAPPNLYPVGEVNNGASTSTQQPQSGLTEGSAASQQHRTRQLTFQRSNSMASSNYSELSSRLNAASNSPHHNGARPRSAMVRRSNTSPDILSATSRLTTLPVNDVNTATSNNKKNAIRKSFDAFIKATKRRFHRKSRKSSEADQDVNAGLEVAQLNAAVASNNIQDGEAAERVPAFGAAAGPLVIPVMNMGPGLPPKPADQEEFDDIPMSMPRHIRAHTTVDYIHCLVPELAKVTNCGYYWGVMDRYEAESLLDNKPEGTFLLRDSSQDDFIFSVSFRRYGRSLHARVEQWRHKFSFDAHDSDVYKAPSVTTLIEHYKDPQACMFFEPMLTRPLNRPKVFSLLHLARGVVCDNLTYDSIDDLAIPKHLQDYCRYYHYKQKIRVRTHSNSKELHQSRGESILRSADRRF